MSYPIALIDRRFNVRLQNIPCGEFLDEGLCKLTFVSGENKVLMFVYQIFVNHNKER